MHVTWSYLGPRYQESSGDVRLLGEHGEVDGRPAGVVAHVQQRGVRAHVQQGGHGLGHAVEDGDVQLAVDKQKNKINKTLYF